MVDSLLSLHFLATGSGGNSLGSSSAVLERDGNPLLLIDCGAGTLQRYARRYGPALPASIYITHLHYDHIGDLESLFYKKAFSERAADPVRIYCSAWLVPQLSQRLADYPGVVAEGGRNFWQELQLIPVVNGFWLQDYYFHVYPVRHHAPNSAFALHLPGRFFYSGDTRPVPELIHHRCANGEQLFHDACWAGNPSHSGVDDLRREYRQEVLQRMWLYHYGGHEERELMESAGFRVVCPGQTVALQDPPERLDSIPGFIVEEMPKIVA